MSFESKQLWAERILKALSMGATLFAVGLFGAILLTIIFGGFERLSLSFLFTPMKGSGLEGGICFQLLGTGILIFVAAIIVTPFSIAIALLYTRFLKSESLKRWMSLSLHIVNSTPSILFGILGFLVFVKILNWDKSWLSGALILALMILPTVTVSLIQRIQTIPAPYVETAQALGFNDGKLVMTVILPYGWGGLLTGLVLGLARAAGETAPIMFTAAVFSGASFPSGIKESPVLALPYHIFNLAQDVYGKGALESAWATAAVLTMFVIAISAITMPLRAKSHEEAKR